MKTKAMFLFAVVMTALLAASGCGDSDENPDLPAYPHEMLASFSANALLDGEYISVHDRVWFAVRWAETTDDRPTVESRNPFVDVYGQPTIDDLRKDDSGVREGIDFYVENEERLWLNCATKPGAFASMDETSCPIALAALCANYACLYDFRISTEAHPEGLNPEIDWNGNPEGWASGALDWEEEFGVARLFTSRYSALASRYLNEEPTKGPFVELTINGDTVHARGWIRRLKEDHNIDVAPEGP